MTLTTYCPWCGARHDLPDDLAGTLVRCANAACGRQFAVKGLRADPTPRTPRPIRLANAAGELVPISDRMNVPDSDVLVAPPPPPPPDPAPVHDWRTDAPPVLPAAAPKPLPPQRSSRKAPPPLPHARTPRNGYDDDRPPGRSWLTMLTLVAVIVAVVGGGGYTLFRYTRKTEASMAQAAEKAGQAGRYTEAADLFEQLARNFPRSQKLTEYKFRAEWSAVRATLFAVPADPAQGLADVRGLFDKHAGTDLLRERLPEIRPGLVKLADDLLAAGERAVPDTRRAADLPGLVTAARDGVGLLHDHLAIDGDDAAQQKRLAALQAAADRAGKERAEAAQWVTKLQQPTPQLVADARAWYRDHPNAATVAAAIATAETTFFGRVQFRADARPPQPAPADGTPPSFLPELGGPAAAGDAVVFARARGLLTALDAGTGGLRWAKRVGLDGSDLPAALPPTTGQPDSVIVAFADPQPGVARVTATSGAVLWYQPLPAAPLGKPLVLAGDRLAVPLGDAAGTVELFAATTGDRLGAFVCEQPFATGGAADTSRPWFAVPLAARFVALFDLAPLGPDGSPGPPRCRTLLPTNHADGSLRHEPLLIAPADGGDGPRTLVLGEAIPGRSTRLRAFRLDATGDRIDTTGEATLKGWATLPPYCDGDRVAVVTDAAVIGLFGVNRTGSVDPPLFPLMPPGPPLGDGPEAAGLVAAATGSDLWVIAGERLARWRLGLDRRLGLRLTDVSAGKLRVGAPLHPAQVSGDRKTLTAVAQRGPTGEVLATAVDVASGRPRWQRTLGLTLAADPQPWAGGLLLLEPTGRLLHVDAAKLPDAPWATGGRALAGAVPNAGRAALLASADGRTAVALVTTADREPQLVVRVVRDGEAMTEATHTLPAGLGGTPALGPDAVLVPLANGVLCRVPLDGSARELGPNWRAAGLGSDVRGHVVALPAGGYAVTDGGRSLLRLTWPAPTAFELDGTRPVEFPRPITQPPLSTAAGVVVADAGVTASLVDVQAGRVVRRWRPAGSPKAFTAAPLDIGGRVLLVVDGSRLVPLDLGSDRPAWEYVLPGGALAATPALVDGKLVVADVSGAFQALDPATGQPFGPPYQHPASVTAAAAARLAGAGRLFAPLSDGSVALLPWARLVAGRE